MPFTVRSSVFSLSTLRHPERSEIGVIEQISVGKDHNAALSNNGNVYMWGSNFHGQLGVSVSLTVECDFPMRVPSYVKFDMISCGGQHTLAVSRGAVYAWGSNEYGQLGVLKTFASSQLEKGFLEKPQLVASLQGNRVTLVCAGEFHSAAIALAHHAGVTRVDSKRNNAGKLFTWGRGKEGQLGLGSQLQDRHFPRPVPLFVGNDPVLAAKVTLGAYHTLVLCVEPPPGQVIISMYNNLVTPTELPNSSSSIHQYLLASGRNAQGQLGTGNSRDSFHFEVISSMSEEWLNGISEISACKNSSVVLSNREIYIWGVHYGLAASNISDYILRRPTLLTLRTNKQIRGISCGGDYNSVCGSSFLMSWGKLPGEDTASPPTPVANPEDDIWRNIKSVECGDSHTLVLTNDGVLFSWGAASHGVLGYATNESIVKTPTSIASISKSAQAFQSIDLESDFLNPENNEAFTEESVNQHSNNIIAEYNKYLVQFQTEKTKLQFYSKSARTGAENIQDESAEHARNVLKHLHTHPCHLIDLYSQVLKEEQNSEFYEIVLSNFIFTLWNGDSPGDNASIQIILKKCLRKHLKQNDFLKREEIFKENLLIWKLILVKYFQVGNLKTQIIDLAKEWIQISGHTVHRDASLASPDLGDEVLSQNAILEIIHGIFCSLTSEDTICSLRTSIGWFITEMSFHMDSTNFDSPLVLLGHSFVLSIIRYIRNDIHLEIYSRNAAVIDGLLKGMIGLETILSEEFMNENLRGEVIDAMWVKIGFPVHYTHYSVESVINLERWKEHVEDFVIALCISGHEEEEVQQSLLEEIAVSHISHSDRSIDLSEEFIELLALNEETKVVPPRGVPFHVVYSVLPAVLRPWSEYSICDRCSSLLTTAGSELHRTSLSNRSDVGSSVMTLSHADCKLLRKTIQDVYEESVKTAGPLKRGENQWNRLINGLKIAMRRGFESGKVDESTSSRTNKDLKWVFRIISMAQPLYYKADDIDFMTNLDKDKLCQLKFNGSSTSFFTTAVVREESIEDAQVSLDRLIEGLDSCIKQGNVKLKLGIHSLGLYKVSIEALKNAIEGTRRVISETLEKSENGASSAENIIANAKYVKTEIVGRGFQSAVTYSKMLKLKALAEVSELQELGYLGGYKFRKTYLLTPTDFDLPV